MKIEVLISTMNIKNEKENKELIKKMNIQGDCLTINQITQNKIEETNQLEGSNRIYSYFEKGLSKSRNHAIKHAKGDICIFADDDIEYTNKYEAIIEQAYKNNPNADIIAFYVKSENKNRVTKKRKNFEINFLNTMRIYSYQITFRRERLLKNQITFQEEFGAGSKYQHGEETIMLCECLKKKMKMIYLSEEIGKVTHANSTWFQGFNNSYFKDMGAIFYQMSPKISLFLILQFAIRKYKLYSRENGFKSAILLMIDGAKERRNFMKEKTMKEKGE